MKTKGRRRRNGFSETKYEVVDEVYLLKDPYNQIGTVARRIRSASTINSLKKRKFYALRRFNFQLTLPERCVLSHVSLGDLYLVVKQRNCANTFEIAEEVSSLREAQSS